MTIDRVVDSLRDERQKHLTHRFPCRAIMVRNIREYRVLLEKLAQIEGVQLVPSSALFSGDDVMPRYENLLCSEYSAKWLILTGVSEYLRLFAKSEAQSQRFAKLWSHNYPSSNLGRIIIPLWGCEAQWHDQSLHLMDDPRKEEIFYNCMDESTEEQQLTINVLSDSFRKFRDQLCARQNIMLDGLKAWYEYWATPSDKTNILLLTGRFNSILPVNGNISIQVVPNTLALIQNSMIGAKQLSSQQCPEEAQQLLFDFALARVSLGQAILSILNISDFSLQDVMGKWTLLTNGQRQLARLWIELHPDESYLYHCVHGAGDDQDIEKRVLHEVFSIRSTHPDWVHESQILIKAMKLNRDDAYFESLNQIPSFTERLHYLSGSTQQERGYILHMVGLWLREDEEEVYSSIELRSIYPELLAYLEGSPYDENLRRYMKLYKMHKLANTLPADEGTFFAGIQPEDYDFRFPILSDAIDENSIVLWIDALGVEWLPLLIWALKENSAGILVETSVGQANLPAETEFNTQWEKMKNPCEKLDKLDKLAHKGVVDDPNYYTCVEEQISFISKKIVEKIESLLKVYHRIVITGDHGASRLAARFFHRRDGIKLPHGGKALNHGRYALVPSDNIQIMDTQVFAKDENGNHYIVFRNYDHFTQSGFAGGAEDDIPIYGEVHGGGTPEEMLVPIVVFESKQPIALKASWKKDTVKISMEKATATIIFNVPVSSLTAGIGATQADSSTSGDRKRWTVVFKGIKPGKHSVSLVADGKLIQIEPLTIQSAIGNLGGDFDW